MRIRILPYRTGSASAKALAEALGGKRLRLSGSTFVPRAGDLIINWGNSQPTSSISYHLANEEAKYLNYPMMIKLVSDKLAFFETHKGASWLPEFWTNQDEIPEDAFPIVCRTVLNGHSGAGIVLADCRDDLVDCSLYVKYYRKTDEFRVHVGKLPNGTYTTIAVQRKARSHSVPDEEVNWQIRNHSNGFIFQRNGFEVPQGVIDAATEAVKASSLDFGAADVGYHEPSGRVVVYEVNTAPGLEGQTLEDYKEFFNAYL